MCERTGPGRSSYAVGKVLTGLLVGTFALFPKGLTGQDEPTPHGHWLTEDENAVVEFYDCEDELCGWLVWLEEGGEEFDLENPDEDLRDRPLCELVMVWALERDPDRPDEWRGGHIYAPDDGRTYNARIRVEGEDRMELRGYVGRPLLGRSQIWTRVSEDDYPRCEPPD